MKPVSSEIPVTSNDLEEIKNYVESISDKLMPGYKWALPKERLFLLLKYIYNAGMKYYNQKVDIKWKARKVKENFIINFNISDSIEGDDFYMDWWYVESESIAEKISKEAEKIFFIGMVSKWEAEKEKIDDAISFVIWQTDLVVNWDS